MGRKKKKPAKPWCWYCNREFDDEKILIQHQKAKHFKCHICHKKLYTGPGLAIHCMQVHKESIDKIPNALPNRNSVDIEVYGMEGIPEGDVREHECKKGDIKPIIPVTNVPPAGLIPGLIRPGMPPLPFMMPPIVHGLPFNPMTAVPPPLPNTAPQLNLPGHPPPPPLNRPPLPLINTSQLPQAPNQPPSLPLPNEPLFSAAITSLSSINNTNDSSSNNDINKLNTNGTASNNVNLIISPPNSKIIHPEEDISLEEFRSRLPKYNKKNELNSSQNLIPNFVINSAKLNISQSVSLSNSFSRNTFSEMNNDNISQPLYSTPNGPPPSKPASFQSTFRPTY